MKSFSRVLLAGTLLAAGVTAASAASADQWMACDGTMVTSGKDEKGNALDEHKTVSDVYAVNDDLKGLYFYSKDKKMLSPEHVTAYSRNKVTWDGDQPYGFTWPYSVKWNGTFDRGRMSINIVRTEDEARYEWNYRCKATRPMPLGEIK